MQKSESQRTTTSIDLSDDEMTYSKVFELVKDDTVLVEKHGEVISMTFLPVSKEGSIKNNECLPQYKRQIPQDILDAHIPILIERECLKCPTKYEGGKYFNVPNTHKPKKRPEPLYAPVKRPVEEYNRDPIMAKLERLKA